MPGEIYLEHAGEYLERYVSVHNGVSHWWKRKFYERDVDGQGCKVDTDTSQHPNPVKIGWSLNLVGQQCCGRRGKHQFYVGYDRGIWGLVADKEDIKDEEMKYKISKPREALWSHRLCFQIFTIVQTSIVPWLRASPVEWSALNNVFRIIISNQWLFTIFLDIINISRDIIDLSYPFRIHKYQK